MCGEHIGIFMRKAVVRMIKKEPNIALNFIST